MSKKRATPVERTFAMTIEVPDFDEHAAYDTGRPISGLIRTQLVHLHQAENLTLPPERRTGININDLQTEGEASQYIRKTTALLRRHGKAQATNAAPNRKTRQTARPIKNVDKKRAKPSARARKRRPTAKRRSTR